MLKIAKAILILKVVLQFRVIKIVSRIRLPVFQVIPIKFKIKRNLEKRERMKFRIIEKKN